MIDGTVILALGLWLLSFIPPSMCAVSGIFWVFSHLGMFDEPTTVKELKTMKVIGYLFGAGLLVAIVEIVLVSGR